MGRRMTLGKKTRNILAAATLLIGVSAAAAQAASPDNFKICTSADDDDFRSPQIIIPPGMLFQSWGPLVGDLMHPGRDFAFEMSDQKNDHYAVETIKEVVLTKAQKCATTTVLVVLSDNWRWKHSVVSRSDNLLFQALEPEEFVDDLDTLPNKIGDYLAMGVLNGTPIGDIKYTKTIK
jgi:hypothetical protein